MNDGDIFRPKLGKIRSLGSKRARKFVNQVLRAVSFAGGGRTGKAFTGRRYGRGAGVGSLLAARDRHAGFRQRRVIVKSRIVKLKGGGIAAAAAHLRYIQRDGVTRDGEAGELYGREPGAVDGKAFLKRCEGDRHQFRFIVAAEDGDQYTDLASMVRKLMARMEADLGTRLDWVAVDHFNTGHPHSHVVLRGKDDKDQDLIIARDYISRGMRERAAEIVTLDLGPRTDREIEARLAQEIEAERFTSLDHRLVQDQDAQRLVLPLASPSPLQQTLRAGRLKKLERLGLAEEVTPGTWRLAETFEQDLRELGLRGDIIKTMHRDLKDKGREKAAAELVIYDPAKTGQELTGRIVSKGLHDEMTDRRYLILETTDGFAHYVDAGEMAEDTALPESAIVSVKPTPVSAREADHTVAEIAARNGGRYSAALHGAFDRTARADFIAAHVRRLEAMRKLTGGVTREPDGSWHIAGDHITRAEQYERMRARRTPVVIAVLSQIGLEQQVRADGATWLDGELMREEPASWRDDGFGREAKQALERRRLWLIDQGLARLEDDRVVYRANLLAVLRRREVVRVGAALAQDLGLSYRDPHKGERIEGIYRRPVDLLSGRYAAIETRTRELVLVPWRPVLDRNRAREVSGIARESGISWAIGRQRSGPER